MKKTESMKVVKGSAKRFSTKKEDLCFNAFVDSHTSFVEFSKATACQEWDGQELDPDRRYHLKDMGGFPLLIVHENRRTMQRAIKMFKGCKENGMTTPAVVIKAQLLADWGMTLDDALTQSTATPEQIAESYVIMEGHGRLHGWLYGYAQEGNEPFDFTFVFNQYNKPEEAGNAYLSTNEDMTRTTNKDRLVIAAARCKNPIVCLCNKRIIVDGTLAKASYFWTYGRELSAKETTSLTKELDDAPTFDQTFVDARTKVYEAFKQKFGCRGAEKIYRGVPAAQWVAEKLHDDATTLAVADAISERVRKMNETLYTAILMAKTDGKKHITRDQVIKTKLDEMMK